MDQYTTTPRLNQHTTRIRLLHGNPALQQQQQQQGGHSNTRGGAGRDHNNNKNRVDFQPPKGSGSGWSSRRPLLLLSSSSVVCCCDDDGNGTRCGLWYFWILILIVSLMIILLWNQLLMLWLYTTDNVVLYPPLAVSLTRDEFRTLPHQQHKSITQAFASLSSLPLVRNSSELVVVDTNRCRDKFKPMRNPKWDHVVMPITMSNSSFSSSLQGKGVQQQESRDVVVVDQQPLPPRCGQLRRRNWLENNNNSKNHEALSLSSSGSVRSLRQEMMQHQTNCSAPVMRFDLDNQFGLGSHLVLWSQALCNAWEHGYRIQTYMNTATDLAGMTNPDKKKMKKKSVPKAPPPPSKEAFWLWQDQAHCPLLSPSSFSSQEQQPPSQSSLSPLLCYFPGAEIQCPHDVHVDPLTLPIVPDPRNRQLFCQRLVSGANEIAKQTRKRNNKTNRTRHVDEEKEKESNRHHNDHDDSATKSILMLRQFRAESFAFLFQSVAPIVVQEAERQLGLLFPETHGLAPANLITVHIRWGDKFWEMDLPSMEEYLQGIDKILDKRRRKKKSKQELQQEQQTPERAQKKERKEEDDLVHIYLATEDPRAVEAFQQAVAARRREHDDDDDTAASTNWRIYIDRTIPELNSYRPKKGNRASWATRNTRGRAGLVALGSLLVALEAQDFVLTTQSNWSRLLYALHQELVVVVRGDKRMKKNDNDSTPRAGLGEHNVGSVVDHDDDDAIIIDLRPGDW